MIPGPTPSGYAWRAAPIQRARRAQAATPFAPQRHKPFSKPQADDQASALKTARIYKFPDTVWNTPADQAPRMADHWFVSKSGRTMSDSAIRLLRLKDWLEICISDSRFEAEAYPTECRLREQAAFIIGFEA